MNISFSKYHGAGNDFIVIDNRTERHVLSPSQVQFLCDRHFGIGSDGLILIESPSKAEVAFDMVFYNPDGSQSLCGNGSRCAVSFAHSLGIIGNNAYFLAYDGVHTSGISEESIYISMKEVQEIVEYENGDYFLNTGSPHHICYQWPQEDEFLERSMLIRHSEIYEPSGTNVNFVREIDAQTIEIRTFERGVEAETLACGTGVTAAALSFAYRKQELNEVNVLAKGGSLKVSFVRKGPKYFSDIILSGPAKFVFSGQIEL